jgi:hypothetical protein
MRSALARPKQKSTNPIAKTSRMSLREKMTALFHNKVFKQHHKSLSEEELSEVISRWSVKSFQRANRIWPREHGELDDTVYYIVSGTVLVKPLSEDDPGSSRTTASPMQLPSHNPVTKSAVPALYTVTKANFIGLESLNVHPLPKVKLLAAGDVVCLCVAGEDMRKKMVPRFVATVCQEVQLRADHWEKRKQELLAKKEWVKQQAEEKAAAAVKAKSKAWVVVSTSSNNNKNGSDNEDKRQAFSKCKNHFSKRSRAFDIKLGHTPQKNSSNEKPEESPQESPQERRQERKGGGQQLQLPDSTTRKVFEGSPARDISGSRMASMRRRQRPHDSTMSSSSHWQWERTGSSDIDGADLGRLSPSETMSLLASVRHAHDRSPSPSPFDRSPSPSHSSPSRSSPPRSSPPRSSPSRSSPLHTQHRDAGSVRRPEQREAGTHEDSDGLSSNVVELSSLMRQYKVGKAPLTFPRQKGGVQTQSAWATDDEGIKKGGKPPMENRRIHRFSPITTTQERQKARGRWSDRPPSPAKGLAANHPFAPYK